MSSTPADVLATVQQRFRQAPKDEVDLVRLDFPQSSEQHALYASCSILRLWSGVLRNALEAQQQQTGADKDTLAAMPLDDTDTAAWEDALDLMHPSVPQFQVTWENAGRLLLLADKYDMPCITEHARLFLSRQQGGTTALQQHLTADNVLEWLNLTSRAGLADCAGQCISYVLKTSLPLPQGYMACLQPETLLQLCEALHKQVLATGVAIRSIGMQLKQAKKEISRLEPLQQEVNKLESRLQYSVAPQPDRADIPWTDWVGSVIGLLGVLMGVVFIVAGVYTFVWWFNSIFHFDCP